MYGFNYRYVREGYRLGKIALRIVDKMQDQSSLPGTYLGYYGYAGVLFEPIQSCENQHRKAFEIGMQLGECTQLDDELISTSYLS